MKVLHQQEFINSGVALSGLLYHGSPHDFVTGVSYSVTRGYMDSLDQIVETYNGIGFQCTDQLYIGLAYTYTKQIRNEHNIGVSLYENNNTIVVIGPDCLEDSWSRLYSNTENRYLYCFTPENLTQEQGLGTFEYTCKKHIKPKYQIILSDVQKILSILQTKIIFHKNK